MPVIGADTIAKNITKFGGGFIKHVNKTMDGVRKTMDKTITASISLTDHSLKDLASLGHPYAKRHGSEGMHIHRPYWLVHRQTGQLLSSKESGIDKASMQGMTLKAGAWVGLNEGIAPHALSIIFGTSRMIPRDVLTGSLVRDKNRIFEFMQQNLKDMVIHFRAKGPT